MRLLQSAVRDFGVGLVVVGGDQAFAAGGYRGTPLEEALPVDMELSSKKVLPKGALAWWSTPPSSPTATSGRATSPSPRSRPWGRRTKWGSCSGMARTAGCSRRSPVGDRREKGPGHHRHEPGRHAVRFQNVMAMAHQGLKASTANLKHMVVFSPTAIRRAHRCPGARPSFPTASPSAR
jgi:hypothetical protein